MRIGAVSLRIRLTAWYAAALALAMIVLSVAMCVSMRRTLEGDLDGELRRNTISLAERLLHEFEEGESVSHASSSLVRKSLFHNLELEIIGPDGAIIASSKDLDATGLGVTFADGDVPVLGSEVIRRHLASSHLDPAGIEIAAVRVTHPVDGRTVTIVAAAGRTGIEAAMSALRRLVLTLVPLLLLLSAAGGWWLANRALLPVTVMAMQARNMSADRLDERLVIPNPDDEVGQLATSFNALLDRLQIAFERMRQFTADASHELRTPVGVVRSGVSVALTPPVTLPECVDTLEIIGDQAVRMSRLVDDMFLLARADAGAPGLADREPVNLVALAESCRRTAESVASEKGVILDSVNSSDPAPVVSGDRLRLEQMLMNLVMNAINHGRAGDLVAIRVRAIESANEHSARIEVEDSGPGIPADQREAVFERFVRLDRSRTRETGGSGLGLPIARWIANVHGGSISLSESESGGCIFSVTLPATFIES